MQKSAVIPKIAISAVLLIVTLVIMIPTLPVMLNKLSGTLDFSDVKETQLGNNRCIEGTIQKLYGSTEIDGAEGTLSKTEYYYLSAFGGNDFNKEGETIVIFFKSNSSSGTNDMLKSISGEPQEFSGVLIKAPANADEMFKEICNTKGINSANLKLSEYVIDLTMSPKAITIRFFIAVAFAVAFAISLSILISAIRRNTEVDYIHHEREMLRAKQHVREAEQPDSDDGIFTSNARDFTNNSQGNPNNSFDTTQYTGITHDNDNNYDDGGFFGG